MKSWKLRASVGSIVIACAAIALSCSAESSQNTRRGTHDDSGGTSGQSGTGGSRNIGGSTSGTTTGGSAAAGGNGAQGGASSGGSSGHTGATGGSPAIPTEAIIGEVSSLGVPWDVRDDRSSPENGISGAVPKIVSFANRDGSLDVAWSDTTAESQIYITHIAPAGSGYEATWHLKVHTLDQLGGFARDDADAMYYLTTVAEELVRETEPHGVQRPNIAHLVKLGADGKELWRTDLRTDVMREDAVPLYSPMTWGTGRVAVGGGKVMLTFSCNTEYDSAVSSRHQWHVYLRANATNGALEMYEDAFGHSWDQRLIYDGEAFIGTSMGDAALRGIGIANVGSVGHRVAFAIKGGDSSTASAYQNVFSRLGDLQKADAGYALLFSSEKTGEFTGSSEVVAPRNLAFVHVRQDFDTVSVDRNNQYDVKIVDTADKNEQAQNFDVSIKDYWGNSFAGKNKGVVWLTDYTDRNQNVERPKLVALGNGHFIALWEKWSLTKYVETFAMVLDEYGTVITPQKSLGNGARLHRQDSAVRSGTKAAWVIGEKNPPKLVLYTLGEDLNLERHEI